MKKILSLNLIFSLLFLTSCSSYSTFVPFEQRIMIQLVGIDWHDDIYTLSVQFSMGSSSDGTKTENDLKTITGQGSNLNSAVKDAKEKVGKNLFFTHNQVLFLGEEVIKNDAVKAIEEYLMYCDYHSTACVAGVYGKAEDLLNLTFKDEYSEKNKLLLIIENAKHTTIYPAYAVYQTLMSAYSESGSFFIPMVRTIEAESQSDTQDNSAGSSEDNSTGEEQSKPEGDEEGQSGGDSPQVFPDGGALVIDGKLIEFLDKNQCEGLSLLANTGNIACIEFTDKNSSYSLEIFNMKTKIIPKYNDENLTFNVKFSAVMYKTNNYILNDLGSNNTDNQVLIAQFKNTLKLKMSDTASFVTGFNGDLFSLEDSLRHRDYASWLKVEDDWREILKEAKFSYSVNIKVI